MTSLHCIDVSGSMSDDMINIARQEMLKRFKDGDTIVVFDCRFVVVTDLDVDFRTYISCVGGTYAQPVLDYAKKINASPILYSDGYILDSEKLQFSSFVKIK